ncbi:aggregation factor core [Shimia sp. R9_2]|uniref:aggregation factor core n=1 Tax=Shimia sp. R9_2 TaxID=2821112 RepID=UPI001ADA42AF|nr:aggregation factor core [Shimia sp. R9_2]MBO9396027.1 aggregation factor core [Shimia sp. R9_2]
MRLIHLVATAACLSAYTSGAFADTSITARFIEGAPKDRFEISNTSACALVDATVTIDLSGSPAGLIFDVSSSGAGVEVFQPFELQRNAEALKRQPHVRDGQSQVHLDIETLPAGETLAFTIDVDDTGGRREIIVSNTEIEGSRLIIDHRGQHSEVAFSQRSMASLPYDTCSDSVES